jgi:asparagine synthase (glutamine-hydrolysing)
MCGINGILQRPAILESDARHQISRMNAQVVHRGPDDSGFWIDSNQRVAFGHQRLSILDLSSAGHQPMVTPNGTAIVFNGEIYNFRELKSHVPDYDFRSSSDTEMILALYEKYGDSCLGYLNGMFAIAIWDPKLQRLLLARDRVGKKPLYFTKPSGRFAFASEIQSLLTLPDVSAEIDNSALYDFLTFSFVPTPQTMFRGIEKLPPGYKLVVDSKGTVTQAPFWEVNYCKTSDNEDELCEQIREAFERSVTYRMVSDVPVGAFLSGGVDSSAIVALMTQQASYSVKTFSIGFDGQPDYDELKFAKRVAKKYGTTHHEIIVSKSDIVKFLPKVVDIFDEPMADPASIPIYFLAKMAADEGLKVVLNGDGPDELLLGYRSWVRYTKLYPWYRRYSRLPGFAKRLVASGAKRFAGDSAKTEILHRAANGQDLFWGGANAFKEWNKRQFLSQDFLAEIGERNCHQTIQGFREDFDAASGGNSNWSDPDWMSYLGLKHLIPNIYTYRSDKLCMAHSVEGRSPFLDYEFINLALSIPYRWKVKNNEPKYILKKALEPILSHDILYRKKQGFCVPLREWGDQMMCDTIEERLPDFIQRHGVFDQSKISEQVSRMRSGSKLNAFAMWNVYFLLLWSDKWIGSR